MGVSFGIAALDETISEVLPEGYLVLVVGSPGAGMELFAKQYAAGAGEKEQILYVSTSERAEDVKRTMDAYGWSPKMTVLDVSKEYYEKVLSKDLLISRYRQEGINLKDVKNLKLTLHRGINFLTRLIYNISRLTPPFRVVIDSMDFYFQQYEPRDVISTLRTIRAHAQHSKSVVLVTMMREAYATGTHREAENIADCIITMETKERPTGFEYYLIVTKVLNHPEKTGLFKYSIGAEGIKAIKIGGTRV